MSKRFKVVCRDNFNRDDVSERWLMTQPVKEESAKVIAKLLNDEWCDEHSSFYADVVPEDYELYVFKP